MLGEPEQELKQGALSQCPLGQGSEDGGGVCRRAGGSPCWQRKRVAGVGGARDGAKKGAPASVSLRAGVSS